MNYGVFSGFFWGVMLIAAGVLMVLKNLLRLNIPVFKLLLGVFFVYLGISMLIGGFSRRSGDEILFSSGTLKADEMQKDYNVIFGQGKIDFASLAPCDTVRTFDVNVIFSGAELLIDSSMQFEVKTSAVFASADLPNDKKVSFGSGQYKANQDSAQAKIVINSNVVFGTLRVSLLKVETVETSADTNGEI